jgi:ABC-type Fe3+/spermidine/putrescine transport system ATPase subunit
MVFQDYALWPHMSVSKNIAFGLKLKRWPRSKMADRIGEMLELVRLSEMKDRYPFQLSGGQQQRVALARALATDPRLLLLDEPLSSLDTQLRESLRGELVVMLRAVGVTTVYVTHDQTEALEMSDVIVVLRDGKVEQVGSPIELYNHPANLFVATFLGATNVLNAEVEVREGRIGVNVAGHWITGQCEEKVDSHASLCIRPESIEITAESLNGKPNALPATLVHAGFLGGRWQHICALPDDRKVNVYSTDVLPVDEGGLVTLHLPAAKCRILEQADSA